MTRWLTVAVLVFFLICTVDAFARGGRGGGGGGRGGGGGGARMGGGGGGMSRPSPSMSRPGPSMSRSAPAARPAPASRPAQAAAPRPAGGAGARPAGGTAAARPAPARPAGGAARPATGNVGAARPGGASARPGGPPSAADLGNFLNMPQASGTGASGRASASQRPAGTQSKSFTTDRGTTITVGGGSKTGTTPGGATVGGAAGGVKIEGAGGNTYVKGAGAIGASKGDSAAVAGGSRAGIQTSGGASAARGTSVRAATDGTNSAIRAGSATGVRDAAGNAAANVRGGYANSSGYRQGASITGAKNQWGYTGVRGAAGFSNNGVGQIGAIGGIRGPGGNAIAAGRGATFANGQFVGGRAWTAVNGAYTRWGYFGGGYWGRYPGAWFPGKWALVGTAWATAGWATAGSYCGCSDEGMYYDYGENVTYEDGTVYYGEEAVASAEQYYDQASAIADAGAATEDTATEDAEWLPLGVFAIISEPDQTQTDKVVQLAINKEGAVRGNYQDFLTDKVTPVVGSVDKETQRVAMKLEGNDNLIVETGLYNLTNDEVPILIHVGADRQEARSLIRLHKPEGEE